MEMLGTLGFEPGIFVAQIINFLILLVIFKLFLYKPVLKLLAERRARIEKGIADADAAKAALEAASSERDTMIRQAVTDAEKIMEETRHMAESLRTQIRNQASREAERILAEAKVAADAELERVRAKAKEMTIEMSRMVLDRVLPELFTETERETIMERNLSKLEAYDFSQ